MAENRRKTAGVHDFQHKSPNPDERTEHGSRSITSNPEIGLINYFGTMGNLVDFRPNFNEKYFLSNFCPWNNLKIRYVILTWRDGSIRGIRSVRFRGNQKNNNPISRLFGSWAWYSQGSAKWKEFLGNGRRRRRRPPPPLPWFLDWFMEYCFDCQHISSEQIEVQF